MGNIHREKYIIKVKTDCKVKKNTICKKIFDQSLKKVIFQVTLIDR